MKLASSRSASTADSSPPSRRKHQRRAAAVVTAALLATTLAATPAAAAVSIADQNPFDLSLPAIQDTLDIPVIGVAVDQRDILGTLNVPGGLGVAGQRDPDFITHHFNALVAENHMKPDSWYANNWQGQGPLNLETGAGFRRNPQATQILNFAQANDMTVFGHVLVWHSQTQNGMWRYSGYNAPGGIPAGTNAPAGVGGARFLDYRVEGDTEIMINRMRQHIRLIAEDISRDFGPFGSDTNPMNSWEVVNEVVAANPNVPSGMRETSPWFWAFGPSERPGPTSPDGGFGSDFMLYAFQFADYYFNHAFHADRPADADADWRATGANRITLWINDYNTERGLDSFVDGERVLNTHNKRYNYLNIVNWLIYNGAPIDGVGHQFHSALHFPVQGLADALATFVPANGFVLAPPHRDVEEIPLLQAITEIDVTVDQPVTREGLLEQGHYFYAFMDIIRTHQATYGDIDNFTLWGPHDGRSWRSAQQPLPFDNQRRAKYSYFGTILGGLDPEVRAANPQWELPSIARVSDSFGASVELSQAGFDAQFGLLPGETFATGTGFFTTRWTPEALYVLAALPTAPGIIRYPVGPQCTTSGVCQAGRRLEIEYQGKHFLVWPDGVLTNEVGDYIDVPGVDSFIDGTSWIVRVEHEAELGGQAALRVYSIENGQHSPIFRMWDGEVVFREDLSVTEVALTDTTPVLDSEEWRGADALAVDTLVAGAADGASAEVRTLWRDGGAEFSYLYLLADVADTTAGAGDSVDVFLSLYNSRGATFEIRYDLRARFHRDGRTEVIAGTPAGVHAQRLSSVVTEAEGGWTVLAAVRLATDTGHQQGQWNSSFGTLGEVFGLDVQVNDGASLCVRLR